MGYSQSSNPEFGLTAFDFLGENLTVELLDSINNFAFDWSTLNYYTPAFRLDGNGCVLVRDITDTVDLVYDDSNFDAFHRRYCRSGLEPYQLTRADGHQFVLPLGPDTLAYVAEVSEPRDDPRSFVSYIAGYRVSLLDAAVLRDSADVSGQRAVMRAYRFDLGDTLLKQSVDFVPDLIGGWWGVARAQTTPEYLRFRLTRDTVEALPPVQIGAVGSRREQWCTRLEFDPAGERFAFVSLVDGLSICSFDRATADIERLRRIPLDFMPHILGRTDMDIEWSASGRFLYVANDTMLHQFDTHAEDVAASVVRLSGDYQAFPHTSYKEIERGPDCRIYVGSASGFAQELSVIAAPERRGIACELKPSNLHTRRYNRGHIPNAFAPYHLYARTRLANGLAPIYDTAVCDASIGPPEYYDWVTATEAPPAEALALTVYPNPARAGGVLRIAGLPEVSDGGAPVAYVARLVDASGREVGRTRAVGGGEATFPVPAVAAGTYYLQVGDVHVGQYVSVAVVVQ